MRRAEMRIAASLAVQVTGQRAARVRSAGIQEEDAAPAELVRESEERACAMGRWPLAPFASVSRNMLKLVRALGASTSGREHALAT